MAVGLDGDRRGGELWLAVKRFKSVFMMVAVVSAVLNVLLLGGSIYMMMVYDSVLPSHSVPTLVGLFAIVTLVYLFQAFFDNLRSGMLADVADGLDLALSRRIQALISQMALNGQRSPGDGLGPMRDLDKVRSFISSTGLSTIIDMPWILFFLAVLFLLHVWLGVTTLIGAIVLFSLTLVTNRLTREPVERIHRLSAYRNSAAETNARHVELLTALGMRARMEARWAALNDRYIAESNRVGRAINALGGLSKILRMLLQSIILTVGALLVIDGKASGGVIFASSILSGRALAPVDQAIANWRNLVNARQGWQRLGEMFDRVPPAPVIGTRLPAPRRRLDVEDLSVGPPGLPVFTMQGVRFQLEAGDAVGVIGPSGAGKSTLGRALIGLWRPGRGSVRLDGATLDQWSAEDRGGWIGYLPQMVELLDGTVAENIARFDPDATSEAIVAAAKAAAAHELIISLPQGYDTRVGYEGQQLSAGQRQRIGLARALFGDPFLVLLDEPNSHLDGTGEAALASAIAAVRARGGIVIVIAHRQTIFAEVSHILCLRNGRMDRFGPRDALLAPVSPSSAEPSVIVLGARTA